MFCWSIGCRVSSVRRVGVSLADGWEWVDMQGRRTEMVLEMIDIMRREARHRCDHSVKHCALLLVIDYMLEQAAWYCEPCDPSYWLPIEFRVRVLKDATQGGVSTRRGVLAHA